MKSKQYEYVTVAVVNRMEKMGTPKSWFRNYLGIAYNTFDSRLKKHNWRKSEIEALKQMDLFNQN